MSQKSFYYFLTLDGEEKTYGGCEGPDAMYVKLISSDGHEFIVKREHALTSETIKTSIQWDRSAGKIYQKTRISYPAKICFRAKAK